MVHTRPIGHGYDLARAGEEMRATVAAYHLRQIVVPELRVPIVPPGQ